MSFLKKSVVRLALLALLGAGGAVNTALAQASDIQGGLRLPTLLASPCAALAYAPVPVYDTPGGLRIGSLVLDEPRFHQKAMAAGTACSFRAKLQFQPEGRVNKMDVVLLPINPQDSVLAVFANQSYDGKLWVQGRTQFGRFWVSVAEGRQFENLERDLVQGLALFSERCDDLGRCTPVDDTTQRLVLKAGAERKDTCLGHAYEIEGIQKLPDGRAVYVVSLAETLAPKYAGQLPMTAKVPIKDFRGRWTGLFSPEGC